MTKRGFLIAGLLTLLLPTVSEAAPGQVCSALRDVTPVSPYVQEVLKRADAGLQRARAAQDNPGLETYFFSWADRIGAAANSLIDSYLTLSVQQKDLLDTTTCLHADVLLLDCKMDEVQTDMQAQLKRKSIGGILELESVLQFLRERKTHLVRGALDPNYRDATWDTQWRFEETDASSSRSSEGDERPMCPFDSDYAPPGSDGYGCDATVLGTLSAYAPARAEKEALDTLQRELDRYKGLGAEFGTLEKELNALYDGKAATEFIPPPSTKQDHRGKNGCDTEDNPMPDDLRTRSVRTPFSFKRDELSVLSDFLGKRAAEGMFRQQAGSLRYPEEIEDPQERQEYEDWNFPLLDFPRSNARSYFEAISGQQGKDEAAVFAGAADSTLRITDALTDLRASVGGLSRLANDKEDGLRGFVIRFAYFLRRSCVYRPCNTSLERILRTAYEDACFPYTDGAFLTDDSSNPRWQQCAAKACIPTKGFPLPADCKEVLPPDVWAKTEHK